MFQLWVIVYYLLPHKFEGFVTPFPILVFLLLHLVVVFFLYSRFGYNNLLLLLLSLVNCCYFIPIYLFLRLKFCFAGDGRGPDAQA
eukprot:gene9387-12428_t